MIPLRASSPVVEFPFGRLNAKISPLMNCNASQVSDLVPGEHGLARLLRIRRGHPHVRTALTALLASAGYYLGGVVGIGLMFPDSPIAIIWPSNAILLAALLLTPVRTWWVYLLAVVPTHQNLVTNFQPDVPLVTMLGQISGNIIQTVIAALAVRRFTGAPPGSTLFGT